MDKKGLIKYSLFGLLLLIFIITIILSTEGYGRYKYECYHECSGGSIEELHQPPTQLVLCCLYGVDGASDSTCYYASSVDSCRSQSGAVQNCIPYEIMDSPPSVAVPQNLTPTNTAANQEFINNLTNAINNASVHSNKYNATTYDCDDFANDLERNLTARGFNATYTYIIKYNLDNTSRSSHAVTDVHASDGSIIFIEPQTGQIINLDIDGDGKIEARVNPNPYEHGYLPTDDNAKITIYPDRASSAAAGAPVD